MLCENNQEPAIKSRNFFHIVAIYIPLYFVWGNSPKLVQDSLGVGINRQITKRAAYGEFKQNNNIILLLIEISMWIYWHHILKFIKTQNKWCADNVVAMSPPNMAAVYGSPRRMTSITILSSRFQKTIFKLFSGIIRELLNRFWKKSMFNPTKKVFITRDF